MGKNRNWVKLFEGAFQLRLNAIPSSPNPTTHNEAPTPHPASTNKTSPPIPAATTANNISRSVCFFLFSM